MYILLVQYLPLSLPLHLPSPSFLSLSTSSLPHYSPTTQVCGGREATGE